MNIFETHIFIVRISMYVGIAFLALSTALLLIVLINRVRANRKRRQEQEFLKKWRNILLQAIFEIPESFTKIPDRYKKVSTIVWNDFLDNLKGEEKQRLIILAKKLNLDSFALKKLDSRKDDERILAIKALGNFGEKSVFSKLSSISSNSKNVTIKLEAFHSMAKIDPSRAVNKILNFLKSEVYYPNYKMALILEELGPSTFSSRLAEIIKKSPLNVQIKLLGFMIAGERDIALKLAYNFLNNSQNPELISSSLKIVEYFGDPRDIPLVKRFLDHEQEFVRMNAVRVLGSIGNINEVSDIEQKLADNSWWVRLRAAEALLNLPKIDPNLLREIRDRQVDEYAIDILNHVLAEERNL